MDNKMQSCHEALEDLTSMGNKTLIATGRWFRRPDQSRDELKRTLPATQEQFQRALDRLQQEIFLAKSLLESDLHASQAKKAPPSIPEPSQPLQTSNEAAGDLTGGDKVPTNELKSELDAPHFDLSTNQNHLEDFTIPETQPQSLFDLNAGTGSADISSAPDAISSLPPIDVGKAEAPLETGDDAFTGDMALGFTSGTELPDPQAHALPALDGQTGIDQTAGSLGSLLPGLENYANVGGEEPMMELIPSSSMAEFTTNQNPTESTAESRPDILMEELPQTESNFDNLFIGDGNDGLMLGNSEMAELDSWFP